MIFQKMEKKENEKQYKIQQTLTFTRNSLLCMLRSGPEIECEGRVIAESGTITWALRKATLMCQVSIRQGSSIFIYTAYIFDSRPLIVCKKKIINLNKIQNIAYKVNWSYYAASSSKN